MWRLVAAAHPVAPIARLAKSEKITAAHHGNVAFSIHSAELHHCGPLNNTKGDEK
jgi:hypothetical protein